MLTSNSAHAPFDMKPGRSKKIGLGSLLKSGRKWLRHFVYVSGLLRLWHYARNRDTLTVVMFHRVLPETSPEWGEAAHDYTLTTAQFAACVQFLKDHYNIVSLDQVVSGERLPARALLITFDDGWADTLAHAAPILRAVHLPAVCFVIGSIVDASDRRWWQGVFAKGWHNNPDAEEIVRAAWTESSVDSRPISPHFSAYTQCTLMLNAVAAPVRDAVLARLCPDDAPEAPRHMLTAEGIAALIGTRIAVGAHGTSHLPLVAVPDPAAEVIQVKTTLERVLVSTAQNSVTALSFPHGQFNSRVLSESRSAGYRHMFTSEPTLAKIVDGHVSGDVYGRLEVASKHYVDADGSFAPERLALRLFGLPQV